MYVAHTIENVIALGDAHLSESYEPPLAVGHVLDVGRVVCVISNHLGEVQGLVVHADGVQLHLSLRTANHEFLGCALLPRCRGVVEHAHDNAVHVEVDQVHVLFGHAAATQVVARVGGGAVYHHAQANAALFGVVGYHVARRTAQLNAVGIYAETRPTVHAVDDDGVLIRADAALEFQLDGAPLLRSVRPEVRAERQEVFQRGVLACADGHALSVDKAVVVV